MTEKNYQVLGLSGAVETHSNVTKIETGNGGLLEVKTIKKTRTLKGGKDLKSITKKGCREWKYLTEMTKKRAILVYPYASTSLALLSIALALNLHPQRHGRTLLPEIIIP